MKNRARSAVLFAAMSLAFSVGALAQAPRPPVGGHVAAVGGEPDYSTWNNLLRKYYEPARGMDYRRLKAGDAATLRSLRDRMAKVNADSLNPKQRLAYLINLYNINVVGIVVDHYPVDSIRDISTDPIIRLNVFKKELVPFRGSMISLDELEHEKIRGGFRDPRIHFAINCAARSCPGIRTEAFVGSRINEQLDEQTRRFLDGPNGVKVWRDGGEVRISTTRIMDWFSKDFDEWGGGRVAFIRRYVAPEKARIIDSAGPTVKLVYDEYDWGLNDWKK